VFKLSTRNRQLQLHNGVIGYDVLAESHRNRFNVRSSVDFSQTDRSLHLKFYRTPGLLCTVAWNHAFITLFTITFVLIVSGKTVTILLTLILTIF